MGLAVDLAVDLAVGFAEDDFLLVAVRAERALGALAALGLAGVALVARVRWASTRTHSSSERLAGLAPWASATLAAFSISATRFFQEVAKRLSD